MIGKSILHYKILEKLGEGGMGVVYLAEDTKLKRQVAIKFLPQNIAANSDERKRFEIEAQAAAALNHPNIATIHAIDETDDQIFLVMEYITGKHLKDYVEARHFVPLPEALDIAIQITKGLQAAHKKGIIHRDIKSSNIMSKEDGQVKIMDFGLAKFRGSAQLTQIGTTVGTAAYMSPEQARGEETDQRADIWSFGVVLYEMLSGHLPFKGDYEQAVIYNILNEDPESIDNPDTPEFLKKIIDKCLQKSPDQRYNDMDEILTELEQKAAVDLKKKKVSHNVRKMLLTPKIAVGVIAVLIAVYISFLMFEPAAKNGPEIKSIAVLPFINVKGDAEIEYLSDGITESLISNLSPLSNLKVMARATVFRFKDSQMDPQQIGRELNVSSVLSGRLQYFENKLVVTAELIDVQNGAQIWGERFNRAMGDIFTIEDEISQNITDQLKIQLESDERSHLSKRYTNNSKAYEYYLKGRFYWNKRSDEGMRNALENFQKAIEIDPDYALAWTGLADTYNTGWGNYLDLPTEVVMQRAVDAAKKALQLDNSLAEAYTSYAGILTSQWRWMESEQAFKKAIELNPGYATAHQWLGELYYSIGWFDQSEYQLKKALEIDPLSLIINSVNGWLYLAKRDLQNAIYWAGKTLEMQPGFADAQDLLVQAMLISDYPASEVFEELLKRDFAFGNIMDQDTTRLRQAFQSNGLKGYWKQKLIIMTEIAKDGYIWPAAFTECYAQLGQFDVAFESLQRLYNNHDPVLGYINIWTFFDPLRSDARFREIVAHMNFPEEVDTYDR